MRMQYHRMKSCLSRLSHCTANLKIGRFPALFVDDNPEEVALIENSLRQNLTAIEEAEAAGRLATELNYTNVQRTAFPPRSATPAGSIPSVPAGFSWRSPARSRTAFAFLGYAPGAFPVSEGATSRIFSLPMHPYLSEADQERIIGALT